MDGGARVAQIAAAPGHGSSDGARPEARRGRLGGRQVAQTPSGVRGVIVAGARRSGHAARAEGAQSRFRTRLAAPFLSLVARLKPSATSGSVAVSQSGPGARASAAMSLDKPHDKAPWIPKTLHAESADLPWRCRADSERMQVANPHLQDVLNRPETDSSLRLELASAERLVCGIEQAVARADALLKKSRRERLTEVEWRGLHELNASIRRDVALFLGRWATRLADLSESETQAQPVKHALQEVHGRLQEAWGYCISEHMLWDATLRSVAVLPPNGPPDPVIVNSRIVPARALRNCLKDAAPETRIDVPRVPARYRQVPGLEQSVLSADDGQTLYAGLRHSFIEADELTGQRLAAHDAGELKALVRELYLPKHGPPVVVGRLPYAEVVKRLIDRICGAIRSDPGEADRVARAMREPACEAMSRELFATALTADPRHYQQALERGIVSLRLCDIALRVPPAPGVHPSAPYEIHAWTGELPVRDPEGKLHRVKVDVRVRSFVLWSGEPGYEPAGFSEGQMLGLLGLPGNQALGGDAGRAAAAMNAGIRQKRLDLVPLGLQHSRRAALAGVHGTDVRRMQYELAGRHVELNRLEYAAGTLVDAGTQLKEIWQAWGRWPAGTEGYKQAAARLALVAHLMGEIPLLNCPRGSGLTRELDAEIKFLASGAARRNGRCPPVGQLPREWEPARFQFSPQ